jgi:hypothetical protein
MCLRRWIIPIAILVSLSRIALAQSSDWAIVKQLLPGQKVDVDTADGKSYVGKVQSVTDDAIRIGKNRLLQKQDVLQVLLLSPGHRGRNTLIGLGVGAGLGVAVGMSCTGTGGIIDPNKKVCVAMFAPVFGGIGAGIGFLLPSHARWHEIYRRGSRSSDASEP